MSNNNVVVMQSSMPVSSQTVSKEASPYQKRRKDKKFGATSAGVTSSLSAPKEEPFKNKRVGVIRTPLPA